MPEHTKLQLSLKGTNIDPNQTRSIPLAGSKATEAVKDIAFGSLAGIVGKIVEYPFDTVKVRLQSQSGPGPLRYSGPLDCFQQSLREDGFRSLYRGISAPMFGAAVETSSLFFSYRLAKEAASVALYGSSSQETLPMTALVCCGAASGAFTSAFLTPIELVKCQIQVPQTVHSSISANPLAIVASVYRHSGILGFWRGQLGTLIRETGGSAAWFGSYEGVSATFRKYNSSRSEQLAIWQQLVGGASAGMAYNFICYPADTIKSRMQTETLRRDSPDAPRDSFWRVGRDLWKHQGISGMYRGCGITVARAAPSSAVIFTVYETLMSWTT